MILSNSVSHRQGWDDCITVVASIDTTVLYTEEFDKRAITAGCAVNGFKHSQPCRRAEKVKGAVLQGGPLVHNSAIHERCDQSGEMAAPVALIDWIATAETDAPAGRYTSASALAKPSTSPAPCCRRRNRAYSCGGR